MSNYPASWYLATINDTQQRESIVGKHSTDTVVVGAGLAGLTTALELLRLGQSVIVLDAHRVAWGASGRNGGFVSAGFAASTSSIIDTAGQEVAQRLYQYSCQGVEYVRRNATNWGPGLVMGEGALSVSRHANFDALKREEQILNQDFGQSIETWPTQKVRSVLRSDCYFDAHYNPAGFHIHPLNYARRLAQEIERLGGLVFEHSRVLSLDKTPQQATDRLWQCQLAQAQIACDCVVLCTSAYDHTLYPKASQAVLPVATYVAVTQPLSDEQLALVDTRAAIADTRRAGDYYRVIDDHRLLWGGKITTRQSVPRQLDRVMQKTIAATYPSLSSVKIDYAWSGLMGYAIHKMPIIAQLESGLWMATAFGGHGLNTTAMAGCLVAEGIANDDQRWRDFAHFGPTWAGGLLGRCGVQLSYWQMQVADRLNEMRSTGLG